MKKVKHSKYKNVSFLSEVIVKKITELDLKLKTEKNLSVYKKSKYKKMIERLQDTYFNYFKDKKKEIYKEFRIHKQILNLREVSMTGKAIEKARSLYNEKVDKNKLNKEIYKLVKELRTITDDFDNFIKESFVENYRAYASIYKSLRYNVDCDITEAVVSEEGIIDYINEQIIKESEIKKYSGLSKTKRIATIYNLKESIITELKDYSDEQRNIVIGYMTKDNKIFNKGVKVVKEGLSKFVESNADIKEVVANLTILESIPKLTQKSFDYACLANDILVDMQDEKTDWLFKWDLFTA